MEGYIDRSELHGDFPFYVQHYTVRGAEDKTHWHKYLQIGLCLKGSGKFFFSNKEYDVEEGDIFISNDFEGHVGITEPGKSTDYMFIEFLPTLLASPGCRQFDYEYLYPFWYNPKTFENKISHQLNEARRMRDVMMNIDEVWSAREPECNHETDALLRLLLTLLIRYYKRTNPDYFSTDVKKYDKLQEALNYINEHFLGNLSVEDVAAKLFMSESRFRHLFKETMNMGFKEHLTYLRLSEAKKLLIYSDMNIREIGAYCCYSNMNQFYKVFYKYVHMSPAEYRKNKKANAEYEQHSETIIKNNIGSRK